MALFHDIAESEIGDIITQIGRNILPNREDKIAAERKSFENLFTLLDDTDAVSLFDEFEEGKTPEARLVKQVDKLEMAIQAYEYEKEHTRDLETFFENSQAGIHDQDIKQILEEIEKLRKK